ncbi:hypothetical protein GDO86_009467 [Hymenochirus boettgeri]|uniref:HSF-type DNA-binding domain-containing protein n=1 Tax=Hymenochirus boettgeri TaxID=247094 RepID=A0A8T2JJ26_9PIPI|nr:hypothetical protein GDO86_009467 [Hymenochirus boettgeri]
MRPSYCVPKFLTKIWALVEDPRNEDYITWSQDGNSFIVLDEDRFAKDILPKHFKHSNMASFVRQLNWYGFHKVVNEDPGVVKQDKYFSGRYQHDFFKRGQGELLSNIKRKVPVPRIEDGKAPLDDNHKILAFLQQLQGRQDVLDSTVEYLKRENKLLWKEILELRQKPSHASPCETAYDRMPSHEELMIDNTGKYNLLPGPKSPKNAEQVIENTPTWSANGHVKRGTKRSFSMREDDFESCSEESSSQLLRVTIPETYGSYQPGDSDCKTDTSETEEKPNEDTDLILSNTDPKHGSEDGEENKTTCTDCGCSKPRHDCVRSSFDKMDKRLRRMHEENLTLTKKIVHYEHQCLQNLSGISSILSTLANFVMNTADVKRPILLPTSLTEETTNIQQSVNRASQCQPFDMWPEMADCKPFKKLSN